MQPLETIQSLSRVAESNIDNENLDALHEVLELFGHDKREEFCNACRRKN